MLVIVDKYNDLHKRTRQMSETQCQYLLLRYCTCQNLNHWMRTVRPDLMLTAAKLFDEETLKTLQTVLWADNEDEHSITLTELQVMQVRQHCKLGGLGLSSAATVMPAAWLGSWSLTKDLVKDRFKDTRFSTILDSLDSNPHQNITVQSIKDTHEELSSAFSRSGRLDKMPRLNCLEEVKSQAQRHYADPLLKNLQTDLLALAARVDRRCEAQVLCRP